MYIFRFVIHDDYDCVSHAKKLRKTVNAEYRSNDRSFDLTLAVIDSPVSAGPEDQHLGRPYFSFLIK